MKSGSLDGIRGHLLFFFVTIVLFLLMNQCYDSYILSQSLPHKKEDYFTTHKSEIKIIFLGDSHVRYAIDQTLIQNSCNFGMDGESVIQTYYQANKLLEVEGFHPDLIVLPFDLHSFSSFRATRFNPVWYWFRYVDFDELSHFYPEISPLEQQIRGLFPIIGKGDEIVMIIQRMLWKRDTVVSEDEFEDSLTEAWAFSRVRRHFNNAEIVDETMVLYFEKILELSQKRNITVVLLKYPVTRRYYDNAGQYVPDVEGFYGNLTLVTGRYDNVYVLDYQTAYLQNTSLFRNVDHLNKEGARHFSRVLSEDLSALDFGKK